MSTTKTDEKRTPEAVQREKFEEAQDAQVQPKVRRGGEAEDVADKAREKSTAKPSA